MSNFVRCFDQLSDPPIKHLLKQSLYHLKEFTLLILLAILKQASWICKVCFLAFLLLGAGVFGWILKWQGLGAFYSTSQRIPKMSDYGQCCSTTSEHTFAVNIFCTAQSTSQKLHPHELPDSQEPLHSRHLWHLKIQPPSVIWHTCNCNKLNLEIFLQPSRHNIEDFLLYLQGLLQLFLATFLVHWQIREFLFNFSISTEISLQHGGVCHVFFSIYVCKQPGSHPQLKLPSALWEQRQPQCHLCQPTAQAWGELWFKVPNCFNSV